MKRPPWLGRAVRVALLLAALAVGGVVLAERWSEVSSQFGRVGPLQLIGAFALIAAAELTAVMSWRALLADLGSPLPVSSSARIVWMSALGKYLPGSVWPYLAQVEMGRRERIPRSRSAAVSILTVGVSLVVGLLIAGLTMPWTSPSATRRFWPVFLAVPALAVFLHPALLNRLLPAVLRILRRPPLVEQVTWKGILRGSGWAAVTWVLSGLQVWALSTSFAHVAAASPVVSIGAYSLAFSAGFLVVFAPAGAGVREAAMTAALSPIMPTAAALTVALISRAITTAGDVGAAAVASLFLRPASVSAAAEPPRQAAPGPSDSLRPPSSRSK